MRARPSHQGASARGRGYGDHDVAASAITLRLTADFREAEVRGELSELLRPLPLQLDRGDQDGGAAAHPGHPTRRLQPQVRLARASDGLDDAVRTCLEPRLQRPPLPLSEV